VSRDDGYEIDADRVVPPGCYPGLFALLELLGRAEDGSIDLDARRRIPVTPLPAGAAPVLGRLRDAPELTLLDCARLMILFGDTVALGVVREALDSGRAGAAGPGPARAGAADPGPWPDRPATVREIGSVLARAACGTLISTQASATVLEILRDTASADAHLVPEALPPGAVMGRLRRARPGALADASVTLLGAETLVASIYVTQDPAETSGRQLVGQLTGLLMEWALGAP
jgi:hypothetical protein